MTMDMQEDWIPALRSWANANDSVIEFWLFGSRAQGCSRLDSDVDLALVLVHSEKANDDRAFTKYFFSKDQWKQQLEDIVERHVSLEIIAPDAPGPDWDSMVWCFGICLWNRTGSCSRRTPLLILRPVSGSPPSGDWKNDDFDVLSDDVLVGRIVQQRDTPVGLPWLWTLHHDDRPPTQRYETTRPKAMAALAQCWLGKR